MRANLMTDDPHTERQSASERHSVNVRSDNAVTILDS